jgi:hypothetical protein
MLPSNQHATEDRGRNFAMTTASWLLIGVSAVILCACQGLNLDPESHRAFAKASAAQTAPPADLSPAASGSNYVASR